MKKLLKILSLLVLCLSLFSACDKGVDSPKENKEKQTENKENNGEKNKKLMSIEEVQKEVGKYMECDGIVFFLRDISFIFHLLDQMKTKMFTIDLPIDHLRLRLMEKF